MIPMPNKIRNYFLMIPNFPVTVDYSLFTGFQEMMFLCINNLIKLKVS